MKNKVKYKIVIVVLVVIISLLHYTSVSSNTELHQFYKLLYFIPVIIAAFNYGFKGGIIVSLTISFIYSPQLLLSIGLKVQAINELLDIILFFAVGIITGLLVEKKDIAIHAIDNQLKKYVMLENYTNSIIESIKSGVIAINKDFFITSVNSGAKNILKISEECIGQNLRDTFTCCESVELYILDAMNSGIFIENIEVDITVDNKNKNININIYPLSLDNKNKGVVIIIEDITVMRKIKLQMQRSDRLASIGQLATGIAHEIRNPLAIIKMIEQTMKSELVDNENAVHELDIIDEEIDRANRVIKELMEFGKPIKNQKGLYSVNTVIEDVLLIVSKYLDQHMVKVNFIHSEIPIIYIDRDQLKQAFVNLIFNATDAMPQGGEINIYTESRDNRWIKVVFADTGEGILEENLEKVFNPFFTTKDEGTGLGLSIVHRIIEEHDGVINVFSYMGEGTRFEILFPIQLEDENI